jgi:hypothetical protein
MPLCVESFRREWGRWVKRDVAMGRSGTYERVGATRRAGGIVVVGGREEMVR